MSESFPSQTGGKRTRPGWGGEKRSAKQRRRSRYRLRKRRPPEVGRSQRGGLALPYPEDYESSWEPVSPPAPFQEEDPPGPSTTPSSGWVCSDRCFRTYQGKRNLSKIPALWAVSLAWDRRVDIKEGVPPSWFCALHGTSRAWLTMPSSKIPARRRGAIWLVRANWYLAAHGRAPAWCGRTAVFSAVTPLHGGRIPTRKSSGLAAALRTVAKHLETIRAMTA